MYEAGWGDAPPQQGVGGAGKSEGSPQDDPKPQK